MFMLKKVYLMINRVTLVTVSFFFLTSCTVPILDKEVKALSSSAESSTKSIEEFLDKQSATEQDELIKKHINELKAVYVLNPKCIEFVTRTADAKLSDCKIDEKFEGSKKSGTAKKALSLLKHLQNYLVALDSLATSKAPDEISTSLAVLIDEISNFSDANSSKGLAKFSADLNEKKDASNESAGFLAEQYKYKALRKAVSTAEPVIGDVLDSLISYFDSNPNSSALKEFKDLTKAEIQLNKALQSKSLKSYKAAIVNFQKSFDTYIEKEKKSPAYKIKSIKDAHTALANRLQSPSDPEEIISFLEKLKSLKQTYDGNE